MTIYLERHDSQKNMARYYRLIVAPTLFGEWSLIAEWGRVGSPGRVWQHYFGSQQEAETAQALRIAKKIRRGYNGSLPYQGNFID